MKHVWASRAGRTFQAIGTTAAKTWRWELEPYVRRTPWLETSSRDRNERQRPGGGGPHFGDGEPKKSFRQGAVPSDLNFIKIIWLQRGD